MNTKLRLPALAVSATLLTGLIAACSPATSQPEPAPATPTVVATQAPAPVETKAAEPEPEGPSYTLADGTTVQIDPTKPLPKDVVKDVQKGVAERKVTEGEWDGAKTLAAGRDYAGTVERETGRRVVIVLSAVGSSDGVTETTYWVTVGSGQVQVKATTAKASQVDAAQAWVARQASPSEWDVIVAD